MSKQIEGLFPGYHSSLVPLAWVPLVLDLSATLQTPCVSSLLRALDEVVVFGNPPISVILTISKCFSLLVKGGEV